MDDGHRAPGEGRYAQVEREQRWLLRAVPGGAVKAAEILDRYIAGTQLRLRRMVLEDGAVVVKLAQKVRVVSDSPEVVKVTNVYLNPPEHGVLAALPAAEIWKTRFRAVVDGHRVSVDEFGGPLAGLILAETEIEPAGERLPLLTGAVRDVTDDDRYSGGILATASSEEVRTLR